VKANNREFSLPQKVRQRLILQIIQLSLACRILSSRPSVAPLIGLPRIITETFCGPVHREHGGKNADIRQRLPLCLFRVPFPGCTTTRRRRFPLGGECQIINP